MSETLPLLRQKDLEQKYASIQVQDKDIDYARQREEEMRAMEKELRDVQDVYEDFHTIVADQQDAIDTLEDRGEQTLANIDSGTQHLIRAHEKQKRNRTKNCWLLGVLLLFCLVLITFGLEPWTWFDHSSPSQKHQ